MAETRTAPTKIPPFLILLLVAATTLYPLSFVFTNAFRAKAEYLKAPYGWPANWSFNNFLLLVENYNVIGAAANSALVIGCALVISLIASTLAAYAIVKLELPGKNLFTAGFVS